MGDLTLSILGFPAVNRDLKVEVRDPVTNTVVRQVQPYLDGTARVAQINPGAYELVLRHDNLPTPVLRRPIRVLPTGDTRVSVVIDPAIFRNTPIEDIPDANLTPVRQTAESVAETVLPLAQKLPGEAIRAQDWNTLATSIRDLAMGLAELTRLVSPQGHNHPEFERKFDEINDNFSTLVNTLNASLAELQRQIRAQQVRESADQVLEVAGIGAGTDRAREIIGLVTQLQDPAVVAAAPRGYARTTRNVAVELEAKINQIVNENPELAERAEVKRLSDAASLLKRTPSTTYEAELEHDRVFKRTVGAPVTLVR